MVTAAVAVTAVVAVTGLVLSLVVVTEDPDADSRVGWGASFP